MNITIFETYTDVVHGNSKNIFLLGRGMQSKDHNVTYLLSNSGKLSNFLESMGLSVEINDYPRNLSTFDRNILRKNPIKLAISLIKYNKIIYKRFKALKPDIVHCTSTRSILSCGFASRLYGSKLVWVIQMEHSNQLLDFFATLLSNQIIFIAESLLKNKPYLLKKAMKSKSKIIPIGIDIDKDSQKTDYITPNQKGLKILCIASLVPNKGIHLLVEAVRDLLKKNYDITCTFVGQEVPEFQQYINAIKNEIKEKQLEKKIIFHGWTSDVKPLLLRNDIFVLPSLSEGLSRSVIEAMYIGLPVIAYDTGALSEIVDKKVGILMEKESHNSLTNSLEFYLNNKNLIKIHGLEARKRVENQYTLVKYLERMNIFYENTYRDG